MFWCLENEVMMTVSGMNNAHHQQTFSASSVGRYSDDSRINGPLKLFRAGLRQSAHQQEQICKKKFLCFFGAFHAVVSPAVVKI